jgi:hypothetical protein
VTWAVGSSQTLDAEWAASRNLGIASVLFYVWRYNGATREYLQFPAATTFSSSVSSAAGTVTGGRRATFNLASVPSAALGYELHWEAVANLSWLHPIGDKHSVAINQNGGVTVRTLAGSPVGPVDTIYVDEADGFDVAAGPGEFSARVDQLPEAIQDIVGGMVTGGVEDGVNVSYDDADGKLDFVNTDKGSEAVATHEAMPYPHPGYTAKIVLDTVRRAGSISFKVRFYRDGAPFEVTGTPLCKVWMAQASHATAPFAQPTLTVDAEAPGGSVWNGAFTVMALSSGTVQELYEVHVTGTVAGRLIEATAIVDAANILSQGEYQILALGGNADPLHYHEAYETPPGSGVGPGGDAIIREAGSPESEYAWEEVRVNPQVQNAVLADKVVGSLADEFSEETPVIVDEARGMDAFQEGQSYTVDNQGRGLDGTYTILQREPLQDGGCRLTLGRIRETILGDLDDVESRTAKNERFL